MSEQILTKAKRMLWRLQAVTTPITKDALGKSADSSTARVQARSLLWAMTCDKERATAAADQDRYFVIIAIQGIGPYF